MSEIANTPTLHPATLLMESHGLAPNVRSGSFASIAVWSKLYGAGSYFVDLNLAPDEHGLKLRGEILSQTDTSLPSEATVTLHNQGGEIVATALLSGDPMGSDGETEFVFRIEDADRYRLEVVFDRDMLSVADIDIR